MDNKEDQHKSGERIAKTIARAGLASRREAEAWIAAGRVAVNGVPVTSPALNVTARDHITVDGAPLPERERTRLFLYHKPRGLITTHADPQGRPTLFERLPDNLPRLVSVGRLDFNTEGLLLLTNDGALARQLELPATGWLRRYRVRAHGAVTQAQLDQLRTGVTVSGIHYGAIDAALERTQGANMWLTFAIREGKNREVRNVLGHLGLDVTRLIRVSFGPFQLGELDEGEVDEVPSRVLREQLGAKLIHEAGADFAAPVTPRAPSPKRETKPPKSTSHSWRAHEPDRPGKKLQRKYHGPRRDKAGSSPERPSGDMRAEVLADRKGRSVLVERHGQPPKREEPKKLEEKRGRQDEHHGGRNGRRRSADRASGPRPRNPHGRR